MGAGRRKKVAPVIIKQSLWVHRGGGCGVNGVPRRVEHSGRFLWTFPSYLPFVGG